MEEHGDMGLAIVILNFRTARVTLDCLESLHRCLGEVEGGARVILVDNGSGDGSAEALRAEISLRCWQSWVDLIAEEGNWGFAGGNNIGLGHLRQSEEWVLLLNSDTIAYPGVLRHCLAVMKGDPMVGVMTCRLDQADGSPQVTARRMPTPLRMTAQVLGLPWSMPRWFGWADLEDLGWDRREGRLREVEWVGGAFMLVRREVLDQVGGLDAGFFFYGEDAEFCHRVRRAGGGFWRIMYDGRVGITHLGGGSSDPERLAKRARDRLSWEARYLLQRRCYGRLAEWYLRGVDLTVYALRTIKLRLTPSRRRDFETHREILSVLWSMPKAKGV